MTHLLEVKQGQVAGAFYKEGLGDIDLVWGNDNLGLKHILKRRSEEKGEDEALKFIQELPQLIQNGEITRGDTRVFVVTPKTKIVISLDYFGNKTNKWIVTAYYRN
ncbi:hypothetical protein [Helicobacter sp. 13S00401-1]|uniref:putative barnase/colicin E5 family endoribonuclease n=1 Tax=Helicobacter sp. 13S00401-1 TaxID=1905758 RepID=UPI0023B96737|nr:hypothetical protein [Helicobacter sp. 13S00401-1]